MSLKIQKLDEIDHALYEQIIALLPQLSEDVEICGYSHFENIIYGSGYHVFCAFDGDKLIGMATMVIYSIPTGYRSVIEDVVVDESCRGMGVGKKLMEHLITFCEINGIGYLNLTSNPKREAANRLYQSLGFKLRETNSYVLKLDS